MGNLYVFLYFPRTTSIHFSHILEIVWISASPEIFKKLKNLKCVFSHAFPVLWKSTFPVFLELYGFVLHPKYLRNP